MYTILHSVYGVANEADDLFVGYSLRRDFILRTNQI